MSLKQLEAVADLINTRPHFTAPMQARRDAWEALAARFPTPPDVACEPVRLGSVPGLWVMPPDVAHDKVILFFHGGGFCLGSAQSHREVLARLARRAGAKGLAIDYRLAPEHPFPAGLDDCVAAYEWLLTHGYEPQRICFAGDSAGGNFVIAAMLALRRKGLALPACGVCWSGWYDLTSSSPSFQTNAGRDIFVPARFPGPAAALYLGGADAKNELASPIFGDLSGFPPLLIQVGEPELLLDDARWLARRAQEVGVPATLEVWPDMPHIWQFFGPILDEGLQATDRSAEFIRRHLG